MNLLKIAIAGTSGRMGRTLIETALNHPQVQLTGALARTGSPLLGQEVGAFLGRQTGVRVSDDIHAVLKGADCLIDFTRAQTTMDYLAVAREHGTKLVIGTTGFTEMQKAELTAASQELAMVVAPNMSIGVNITFKLLEMAAGLVPTDYDVEIIEAHHRHKVDAPSGTALKMGETVAQARGLNLDEVAVYGRQGVTGERQASTIGFATVRAGNIVGDHTVLFAGDGERIEITHKSASRASYAQGALRAAQFIANKSSGLFDMQDVLGLR